MLKIADIVYHYHEEYNNPEQVLQKHEPTLGFLPYIKDRADYLVVRHMNHEQVFCKDGIRYAFFKRRNAPWQIPLGTHRFIQKFNPDIVLVHGFLFPLQVIALKKVLKKNCAIVLQHHADQPAPSIRLVLQKMADRYVDSYMFTAGGIAESWLSYGVIANEKKVSTIAAASARVLKRDKMMCRQRLGMTGNANFLWVGRLNDNKDPLTVLRAFARYIRMNTSARLYMIYQTDELLAAVSKFLLENKRLKTCVHLIGKLDKEQLADWYNAADFFISGSHAEAAGYALLEALSVGCIPLVTAIPSYKQILNNGQVGYLYTPGNVQHLITVLEQLPITEVDKLSAATEQYYHDTASFKSVAGRLYDFFLSLHLEKG